MPKEILIATGNQGKLGEILEFFDDLVDESQFKFLSLNDVGIVEEPDETGDTFEENALEKAIFYSNHFQLPTISEDSGLILSAMPEKFGLYTKREIQASSDQEWLEKFLEMLEDVDDRDATFFSAMAFVDPHQNIQKSFLGKSSGQITLQPESELEKGIPVSAVFQPHGLTSVFSKMAKSEKNKISHRGYSANDMINFLKKYS